MSLPAKLAGKGNIAKQLSAKPLPGALYMNSGHTQQPQASSAHRQRHPPRPLRISPAGHKKARQRMLTGPQQ